MDNMTSSQQEDVRKAQSRVQEDMWSNGGGNDRRRSGYGAGEDPHTKRDVKPLMRLMC